MLSTVRRLGGREPAVVAIFLIGLVAIGCSGAASQMLQPVGAPAATAGPAASQGALSGQDGNANGTGGGDQNGQPPAAPADLLIIKTGALSLQVTGLDGAVTAATRKVDE